MSSLFEDADVIDRYTRRQAIEDGVLVQLSGPGYEGDPWVPAMVAELGFQFPVAITAEAFARYVDLTPAAERAGNDIRGRLWDVLYMLRFAIHRVRRAAVINRRPVDTDTVFFDLYCVVDRVKPQPVRLKSVCGPGDDAEPVLTIMLPHED